MRCPTRRAEDSARRGVSKNMRFLITGVSGTGKTKTLAELQKHGYATIDLDATGICKWKDLVTGEVVEYGLAGRNYEWLSKHGWYCDIAILQTLLSAVNENKDVFVAGIAENIDELADVFNNVFILTASDSVVRDRLSNRSNNDFAKKEEEQSFVLEHSGKLLKKIKNFIEVDADQSPSKVVEIILGEMKKLMIF
jgi:broad-specificity NMP kinase